MNKEDKVIEPKLRFPEFKGKDFWKTEPLGMLAKPLTDKVGEKKVTLMSITSGVGLVSQLEKFGREIAGSSQKNYILIKKGDFAYNKSSTKLYPEGEVALLEKQDEGAVPNSIFTCFRFCSKVIPQFAKHPFSYNIHGNWLRKFIAVGARANGALQVNNKDLFATPFPFPSPYEQQKIADCLSSLDELIQAETERLEALQAHKKGLMQQLFPAEGETVPKLRFPEFQDSGEWVERELKKHLVAKPDYGINAPAVPYSKNLPTYLRITDISDEGNYKTEKKVSVAKPVSKSNYLTKGDIVITRTGASVGKSYLYSEEDGKLVFAGFLIRVKPDSSKLLPNFLSQFLTTDRYWEWVVFNSTRSGQPGLNGKQIESIQIPMPPSIEEQKKISEFLSSINDEIFTQNEKIETLKSHKKGLLQQLFPQLD